jgi:uncharacterized cupredoxin-like copper-binding protein
MRLRTAIFTALAALTAVVPATAAPRADQAAPINITVTARDFSFAFSKSKVPHGSTVIFTVVNKGQLDHNLVFTTLKKQSPLLGPGKKGTVRITFAKKGHYGYLCSVPNHAQAGMAGAFTVT